MSIVAIPMKRRVHYRRVEVTTPDGPSEQTLQKLIEESLKSDKTPEPIERPIGSAGSSLFQIFVTRPNKEPNYRNQCLCGTLLFRDTEKIPPSIAIKGKMIDQKNIPIVDDEGNIRQLEENHIHFAVRDNHVAILSASRSWKSEFEDFLMWLIVDQTNTSEKTDFELRNIPTKEAQEKVENSPVKKVGFTASRKKEEMTVEGKRKGSTKKVTVYKEDSYARRLLEMFAEHNPFMLKKIKDADLTTVSAHVDFFFSALRAEGHEEANESGKQIVKDIAAHLGGHDEIEPIIQLEKGRIKGDELTIDDDLFFQIRDGNVDQRNAWTVLGKWLTDLDLKDKI